MGSHTLFTLFLILLVTDEENPNFEKKTLLYLFINKFLHKQLDHCEREANERGAQARNEVSAQVASLQRELNEERLRREEALSSLQAEKERELQQVYNR